VIAKKGNVQIGLSDLKKRSQRYVPSAFKELFTKFTNPEAAMSVTLPKGFRELDQRQQAIDPSVFCQVLQPLDHIGIDGQELIQASSSIVPL
jgi:hypothetical protein